MKFFLNLILKNYKLLFAFYFSIQVCQYYSQIKTNDVATLSADTNEINSLNADILKYKNSDPYKALELAKKSSKLADRLRFESGLFQSLVHLIEIYYSVGKKDSSFYALQLAEYTSKKLHHPSYQAELFFHKGSFLLWSNSLDSATFYFVRSLKIYTELKDTINTAYALVKLGDVYSSLRIQKQYDFYMQKALTILEVKKDSFLLSRCYFSQSHLKFVAYDFDSSKYYILKSIKICPKNNLREKEKFFGHISSIYFNQKLYDSALYYARQCVLISQKLNLIPRINSNKLLIAKTLFELKKYNEAENTLLSLLPELKKENKIYDIMHMFLLLSDINAKKNNFALALDYYKKAVVYDDSLEFRQNRKLSLDISAKYETEKKDAQIVLLDKVKQLNEIELTNNKINQRNLIIVGIALLIIMGLIGLLFFQNYKQKQQAVVYKLENEKIISDLSFLKAQVNPHTIFNTINSIYVQLSLNFEQGRSNLLKFANVLRYQLYDCDDGFVPLENEIEHIKKYIELQKLRKSSNNKINLIIDSDIKAVKIAPLLFIPLIENAFKYLSNFKDRDNFISINLFFENKKLIFKCANTFVKRTSAVTTDFKYSGIGLVNLKRRLELTYPKKHSLNLIQEECFYKAELIIDAS